MAILQLDHCVIRVADWERSIAFYARVLGAELVPSGQGWAYRAGTMQGISTDVRDPDGSLLEFIAHA